MKRALLYLLLLIASRIPGFSQHTFNSSDFATLNDSFIVSQISIFDYTDYDFVSTGDDTTWDYADFIPVSQEQKRFSDPDYTGFRTAYFFSCNTACYNPCYSNCVNSGGFPLVCAGSCNFTCNGTCLNNWLTKFDLAELTNDSINLIITSIQDIFNFYDLSSSALSQVAVGARLSGFPIVLEYQNPDRIYSFPLQYNNRDTSNSNFLLELDSIPGTGFVVAFQYKHSQQRYNHVEGWGTLKTPYGVFDSVIKLKSIVESQDTLVIQGNSVPLSIIPQQVVEYKWFSPDFGIPLLKVTARIINGTSVIQDIEYIDSLRCFDPQAVFGYQPFPAVISQNEQDVEVGFFSLSINGNDFTWDFGDTASSNNSGSGSSASHTYTEGGLYTVTLVTCNAACSVPVCDTFSLPVLILDLSTDTSTAVIGSPAGSAMIYPNPASGKLLIYLNSATGESVTLAFYDLTGKVMLEFTQTVPAPGLIEADISNLPAGTYIVKAETETLRQVHRLVKAFGRAGSN